MEFIMWILAIVLIVAGVFNLISGNVLWGIVLIVVGCVLGGFGGFNGFGPRGT